MSEKKKIKINRNDFELAFDISNYDTDAYLDTETGEIIIFSEYLKEQLQEILDDESTLDEALEHLENKTGLGESEKDELRLAIEYEFSQDADRYRDIPKQDSRDGYRDMQEYIWSLEDEHLKELLEIAIDGKGAFRRFKDVLIRYPEAEENWFKFQADREYKRMMEWFEEEEIEPEFV